MRRLAGMLVVATFAISAAACGTTSAADTSGRANGSPAPATAGGDAGAVHIDAKDIAFTQRSVTAPADRPFRIVFDSQDGAPHNVTIVGPDGNPAFTGDVVSGPGSTTYAVPALTAGSYPFRCDIHPDMAGTLVVR